MTDAMRKGDTAGLVIHGGASEIIFNNGEVIVKDLILQDKISGVSVAIPHGKAGNRRIFMGSWADPKLAICEGGL